jgi:hypothetical protein
MAGFAAPPGWFGSAANNLSSAPPPPVGFAADFAEPSFAEPAESAPMSWGNSADLSSPSDFVFDEPAPPPPPGFGAAGYEGVSAVPPPPPPGFGGDFAVDAPPPPPPGYGTPPDQGMAPPPPGYGNANPVHASSAEVFGYVQDMTSLVNPQAPEHSPEPVEESRFLVGTGPDRTSYASVPPITPDFFARSTGRGRR